MHPDPRRPACVRPTPRIPAGWFHRRGVSPQTHGDGEGHRFNAAIVPRDAENLAWQYPDTEECGRNSPRRRQRMASRASLEHRIQSRPGAHHRAPRDACRQHGPAAAEGPARDGGRGWSPFSARRHGPPTANRVQGHAGPAAPPAMVRSSGSSPPNTADDPAAGNRHPNPEMLASTQVTLGSLMPLFPAQEASVARCPGTILLGKPLYQL